MKILKIVAIVFLSYVGIVATFESLIGYFQPEREGGTLVLTTFDSDGAAHPRVLARVETDGNLYVSVNHWPRAWYTRALENPEVRVRLDGPPTDYRAVPIAAAERERVVSEHRPPLFFRFLTGFPPREILRLDPASS